MKIYVDETIIERGGTIAVDLVKHELLHAIYYLRQMEDKKEDDEEVAEIEISKAVEPKKSKGLIEEIEEMKANGMTGTDEFREKQKKLEQHLRQAITLGVERAQS